MVCVLVMILFLRNMLLQGGHQLYRIEKINEDGTLELKDHRFIQGGIEEDV